MIPGQFVFWYKAQFFIYRPAQLRGVETNSRRLATVKMVKGMSEQMSPDTSAPMVLIDQDHRYPGDVAKDTSRCRTDGGAIQLGHEAASGLEIQQAQPVRLGLVPSRLSGQSQAECEIVGCHRSNADNVHESEPAYQLVRQLYPAGHDAEAAWQ